MEDFDLSGYTLFERQSKFYNGNLCPYCLKHADFVDSAIVYQRSYGMIYYCGDCRAWVNTHHGGDQSMGTLAKATLRDLRHKCHLKFEPLCIAKVNAGAKKKSAKAAGYNWLAKILNIDPVTCHVGYFNIEQCKKVIEACDQVYADMAKKRELIKFYVDCVNYNAEEFGYEVKEFKMNGMIQLELTHRSGKILNYQPKDNIVKWSGIKSKWEKIDCIEKFIYKHFK